MKAVIIDDNPLAIATLKADITTYCQDVELVGEAEGVLEAAKLLNQVKAELLFLDIHMNNGTGFDLLDIVEKSRYKVIFTTASEDFALKAFEYAAVDYLLKPIDPERLQEAVGKSLELGKLSDEQISIMKSTSQSKLALSTTEEIRIVGIEQILRLESSNNYTTFYLDYGEKILVSKTMKEYDFLTQMHFMRVHQSHIINMNKVKSFVRTEGGYILLTDGSHVPVSVRKKPEVIKALQMD